MQKILRVGDQLLPADDDAEAIAHTGEDIAEVARKYKTDVLAAIGKGPHTLTTLRHQDDDTELWQDLKRIIDLIDALAQAYDTQATDIVDALKIIMEKGDEDGKE